MNKLVLSALAVACLGAGMISAAHAADGTITYNGAIGAVTCTVHGGAPGAAGPDFTVTLPSVPTTSFTGVGSAPTNGQTMFNIYVGAPGEAGCTNGTNVSVHYEPTSPRVATNGNLDLDPGAGAATGVQLQILDSDKTLINLTNASDSTSVVVAGNQATLPGYVQYFQETAAVTPGTANSSVLYSIKYN